VAAAAAQIPLLLEVGVIVEMKSLSLVVAVDGGHRAGEPRDGLLMPVLTLRGLAAVLAMLVEMPPLLVQLAQQTRRAVLVASALH
jgi:hypothetical protein